MKEKLTERRVSIGREEQSPEWRLDWPALQSGSHSIAHCNLGMDWQGGTRRGQTRVQLGSLRDGFIRAVLSPTDQFSVEGSAGRERDGGRGQVLYQMVWYSLCSEKQLLQCVQLQNY